MIPRIDAVLRHISAEDTILDIGCVQHSADKEQTNPDWLHGQLTDIAEEVVGIDILEEEIRKLEKRGYNVEHASAEDFSIDQEFDAVVAGETIEHLANPGQFLERAREHLKPDGRLILTTPNPWMFPRFVEALKNDVFVNEEHTCWFDEKTMRQLLGRCGFDVRTLSYVEPTADSAFSLSNRYLISIRRAGYDFGYQMASSRTFLVVAVPAATASN